MDVIYLDCFLKNDILRTRISVLNIATSVFGAMVMKWSWDQGRLQYFQFDNLKAIAHTLAQFDNVRIDSCESIFRQQLENNTGLPFAPKHYAILRNYRRVFESALLATDVSGYLQCTDICREMAKTDSSLDY